MDARKLLRQKRAARSTQAKNPQTTASKPNQTKPAPPAPIKPEDSEAMTTIEPVITTPGPDPDEALVEAEMEEFARFLATADPIPETIPDTTESTSKNANAVDDDDDDETAGVEDDMEQQTISARVLSLRRKFDASSKVLKRSATNGANISIKKLKPIAAVVPRRNDDAADAGEDSESDSEADAWRRKAF
ncbi:hypothetical protein HDU78_001100 [Chytriomyces hyalinus]|nr:hypothetical protein HDU78_001100 [Chytriomyces hyalinus]